MIKLLRAQEAAPSTRAAAASRAVDRQVVPLVLAMIEAVLDIR